MNRLLRGVRHVALALLVVATLGGALAVMPGESWAQQLVRATITNTVNVAQSGTWTVQPGNTANTTAWLVTGTGGVFPSSQSGVWSVTADTELAAGASLADNTANPSVPGLAAYMMVFDGTNWDRAQASVDATHGSTVVATGPGVLFEAKDQDGSAFPNTVTEGQAIRPAASMSGVGYSMIVSEDGAATPQATIGSTPLIRVALFDNANNQITAFGGSGGTASNFGSSFPTPGTAAGFNDGTNMQGARVGDLDTDAGTFYALWAAHCVGTTAGCSEPAYGAGANSALVQRFTLATDDEVNDDIDNIRIAVETLDNAISGAGFNITQIGGSAISQTAGVQNVNINNATYDPCMDPAKVLSVPINASAASGATQHVAISGSTRIFLCGGSLQGGAAGTITVRFGTGTACATSPTDIDVVYVQADGVGKLLTTGGGMGTILRSGTGQALCSVRSASMTAFGNLRYVQE